MNRTMQLVSFAAFLVGITVMITAATESPMVTTGAEVALLERVNRVRDEHHLRSLRSDPMLVLVARGHAEELAREGYLSHVNREGQNPLERARAAGLTGFRLLAENIGASSVGGDRMNAILEEWLRSPDHRENLLNPAFNATGVAVVRSPEGNAIVVELFATFSVHDSH